MKLSIAASTAALALLLTGCGGGGSDDAAPAAQSGQSSDKDKEASLKQTVNGYYEAMLKGNVVGMGAYYRPGECESEIGGLFLGSEMLKGMLDGVTSLKVTKVKVTGDVGEVVDGKAEGKLSDATKRMFEADDSESDPWQFVDGKWWATCKPDATASPTPTT